MVFISASKESCTVVIIFSVLLSRYFSRSMTLRVLHLYTASAMSPRNGTKPMNKSITAFRYIFVVSAAGRPPSMPWQVWMTMYAMKKSRTSPTLQRSLASRFCNRRVIREDSYAGMNPITLLYPNLMPKRLNNPMSSRYARLLALTSTFPSCSDTPAGIAFRRLMVFFDGWPLSSVAGTRSKYGS